MHELALAEAIAGTVRRVAEGRPVERVDVRIGHFRQVVPDSLTFAWEATTAGTDLRHCTLAVDYVPAVAACRTCAAETTLDWPVLVCASCGGTDVALRSGDELEILTLDVGQDMGQEVG